MKPTAWRGALCGAALIGFTGLLLVSCGGLERIAASPPMVAGAEFVGNRACVECHTNISRTFPASEHGRFSSDDLRMGGATGCESCHGPASLHVEAGGGRGKFIVNPGRDPTACLDCHLEVHGEFRLPSHHRVLEGWMNCMQCHDPHGHDIMKPARGLAMARENETCAECHREQSRPFVFEHEALREGCTVCHEPHGSINRKMLTERDNNLCLKCHLQVQFAGSSELMIGDVPHSAFLSRGTCWSSGCHTAVHGSNVHPQFRY